jgi:Condensation domain
MAVVARGHKQRIKVSLHDVLRSQSISQLARTVEASTLAVQQVEENDEPFDLSPIQRLYFQSAKSYQGRSRFNQSISVRFLQEIDPNTLGSAIRAIIHQHSMLRIRFSLDSDGNWQQRITKVRIFENIPLLIRH